MTDAPQTPRRFLLRRLVNALEVDRATFYALAARGWQFVAGPITLLLIAWRFSPELQGFYYAFWGLLALQTFFELGFSFAIVNVASHEFANLEISASGELQGKPRNLQRLAALVRIVFQWYGIACVGFIVIVGSVGAMFLANRPDVGVSWLAPWLVLAVLNGLLIWALPFSFVLEGCNQVIAVHKCAVVQAVTGNIAVWSCIVLGGGLWAVVAATGVRLFWYVWLYRVPYRRFFASLWKAEPTGLSWRNEVWPWQWRLAVQGVFAWFATWLVTLVLFHYHGAAAAGRMGMTWNILTVMQTGALAWLTTRAAKLGMLAAKQDHQAMQRMFFRAFAFSLLALAVGGGAFCGGVWFLNAYNVWFAERLLAPIPLCLFLIGTIAVHIAACLTIYVRAMKQEPFLTVNVIACTFIGVGVWWCGATEQAATGAAMVYAAVNVFFTLPASVVLWKRSNPGL